MNNRALFEIILTSIVFILATLVIGVKFLIGIVVGIIVAKSGWL